MPVCASSLLAAASIKAAARLLICITVLLMVMITQRGITIQSSVNNSNNNNDDDASSWPIKAPCNQVTPPVSWHVTRTKLELTNMVTYERDGSLFVAARGDIYRYSGSNCNSSSSASSSQGQLVKVYSSLESSGPHVNKVFHVLNLHNETEKLLSCWQARDLALTCGLLDLSSLEFIPITWSLVNKTISLQTGPDEEIRVMPDSKDHSNLLIVTSVSGGRQPEQIFSLLERSANELEPPKYLPTMSKFKLLPKAKQLNMTAYLPFHRKSSDYNFQYGYAYTFHHDGFNLFLNNNVQKKGATPNGPLLTGPSSNFELGRVCCNCSKLTSYSEVKLGVGATQLSDQLYAKVAYFDMTTSSPRGGLEQPKLLVIYEHVLETERDGHSYLHTYLMKDIDDVFYNAMSQCHHGNASYHLIERLHRKHTRERALTCRPSNVNQRLWCTSKTNCYIDGFRDDYFVKPYPSFRIRATNANFLLSVSQGGEGEEEGVYFIGEAAGLLTKYSAILREPFYTINVHENRVIQYNNVNKPTSPFFTQANETESTKRGTKFTYARGIITAINNLGEIHEIPIDSCQYYTSCFSCVASIDPLKCVWCGNSCQSQGCAPGTKLANECPPYIAGFAPRSGPTSGNTRLVIAGDGFGGPSPAPRVLVGGQACEVDANASDNVTISCRVPPVAEPTNATISVNQSDKGTFVVAIEGTTSFVDAPFEYKQVRVHGCQPAVGPRVGGIQVSITGENLDVGALRMVKFGETECGVTSVEPGTILCNLSALNESSLSSLDRDKREIEQPLRVIIDGMLQNGGNLSSSANKNNASSVFVFQGEPPPPPTQQPPPPTPPPPESLESRPVVGAAGGGEAHSSVFLSSYSIISLVALSLAILLVATRKSIAQVAQGRSGLFSLMGGAKQEAAVGVDYNYGGVNSHARTKTLTINHNHKNRVSLNTAGPKNTLSWIVKPSDEVRSNADYFSNPPAYPHNSLLPLDDELMSMLITQKILIDRNRLTLGQLLGSGQFGRVYKGFLRAAENTWEHTPVAIKTLQNKSDWIDTKENRAFLEEGLMMKDFNHENVLTLIGVSFDPSGLPMVITPFMLHGDLKSYIMGDLSSLTLKELIEFGIQIARGMAHLSSLKFVHRDLAARNCMLDEHKVVKVADFGLSRDIYGSDYYSSNEKAAKLPVKWMAIESLQEAVYTSKSDVWSYGIVLWELTTGCVVPYPDVDNFDILDYLEAGRRLLRPRKCPVSLYEIMQGCWRVDPAERPGFDELVVNVTNVITGLDSNKEGIQPLSP